MHCSNCDCTTSCSTLRILSTPSFTFTSSSTRSHSLNRWSKLAGFWKSRNLPFTWNNLSWTDTHKKLAFVNRYLITYYLMNAFMKEGSSKVTKILLLWNYMICDSYVCCINFSNHFLWCVNLNSLFLHVIKSRLMTIQLSLNFLLNKIIILWSLKSLHFYYMMDGWKDRHRWMDGRTDG